MMQNLATLSDFRKALDTGTALIDFTATWCGPCRQIAPKIEALARENPEVKFYKVDIDLAGDVAARNGVRSVPTFRFFGGGQLVGEVIGADLAAVKRQLRSLT